MKQSLLSSILVFLAFIMFLAFLGMWINPSLIEGYGGVVNCVLIGDSIMKNDAYVGNGSSVSTILLERKNKVVNMAQDHSVISDMFLQVNMLPVELNHSSTYVFVSAGGNNILSHYVDNNNDVSNKSMLTSTFESYKNLIETIRARLPSSKICVLDIYYPSGVKYHRFYPIITEWNRMLDEYAATHTALIYRVVKISKHVTHKQDFTFDIEPSSVGGEKIATLIQSAFQ